MKLNWSHFAIFLTVVMMITTLFISSYVEQSPQRQAYSNQGSSSDPKWVPLPTKPAVALTDNKLINWIDETLAKCFSLTQLNIDNKSAYCQHRYFVTSAGAAYATYVDRVRETLTSEAANQYVALPYAPLIVQSPSVEKQRFYYTVYATMVVTTVERKSITPRIENITLYVKPSRTTNYEGNFVITGIRI
ncbi:hypothetical protein [Vibrio fluvialis]|uniref:hypothetical protein n=1 Tax=Vibrio fluvialis TaxID=676 RepID=UPI0023A9E5F0|nr:hypothetical protein [Vibrio fluvialis]MDE5179033.1 hypothetical protein [Vibrio fluvialis]